MRSPSKALTILQQQQCLLFAYDYAETQDLDAARALAVEHFRPLLGTLRELRPATHAPNLSDVYSHGARDIHLIHEELRTREPLDAGMLLEEALAKVVFGADPRLYLEAMDEVIVVSRAAVPPVLVLHGREPVKHTDLLAPCDLPVLFSAGALYICSAGGGGARRAAIVDNSSTLITPSTTSLACVSKNLIGRYGFELVVAVDHAGREITILAAGDDFAQPMKRVKT